MVDMDRGIFLESNLVGEKEWRTDFKLKKMGERGSNTNNGKRLLAVATGAYGAEVFRGWPEFNGSWDALPDPRWTFGFALTNKSKHESVVGGGRTRKVESCVGELVTSWADEVVWMATLDLIRTP